MYANAHLGFNPLLSYQGVSSTLLVMCPCAGCREPGHLWVTVGHSQPRGCQWTKTSFSFIWEIKQIKFWTLYWGGFNWDRIENMRKAWLRNQIRSLVKHTLLSYSLLRPHLKSLPFQGTVPLPELPFQAPPISNHHLWLGNLSLSSAPTWFTPQPLQSIEPTICTFLLLPFTIPSTLYSCWGQFKNNNNLKNGMASH